MRRRGRDEVRVEADGVEQRVGGEPRRDVRPVGGCGVDAAEGVADAGRHVAGAFALRQNRLPDRVTLGRQPRHRERTGLRVLAQDRRDGGRDHGGGDAHPLDLVAAALDRNPPVGRHLEPRQRALDANDAGRQVGAVDVRRHAAGQRCQPNMLVSTYYRHSRQCTREFGGVLSRGGGRGGRSRHDRRREIPDRYAICIHYASQRSNVPPQSLDWTRRGRRRSRRKATGGPP